MKPGERPPRELKEFVLRLAGSRPRPTNREICQAVERRFGLTLDDRTIGRYCQAAGVPTSSRQKPGQAAPLLILAFDPNRPEDLGLKTLDGESWQVACFRVENKGPVPAKGCVATLVLEEGRAITGSQGPFPLNPVDEPYTLRRDTSGPVDIPGRLHRIWDLVLAPVAPSETRPAITSGPVYTTGVPAHIRGKPPQEMNWAQGGACIATPIAMTRRGVPQAHLLPGQYVAQVVITDESGNSVQARFRIGAPLPTGALLITRLD